MMQRKSFEGMNCPVARSLDRVGEWWSILILRDAINGATRFDQFSKSLGIAANILTKRLNALVEAGLLERVQYCERPPRFEYRLTPAGMDFRPVILSLVVWGNKYFSPEGPILEFLDLDTGKTAIPILVDKVSGKPISKRDHVIVPGPGASEAFKNKIRQQRLEAARQEQSKG
jgi:DNA-binding HxlR family transcriptional regulator